MVVCRLASERMGLELTGDEDGLHQARVDPAGRTANRELDRTLGGRGV
jgi:hypothetical protein